jgi:hypothetical protein
MRKMAIFRAFLDLLPDRALSIKIYRIAGKEKPLDFPSRGFLFYSLFNFAIPLIPLKL